MHRPAPAFMIQMDDAGRSFVSCPETDWFRQAAPAATQRRRDDGPVRRRGRAYSAASTTISSRSDAPLAWASAAWYSGEW
jgi:hypothetical protein